MTQASFELGRGTPLTAAAVGKTIVHRPTRDVGFPLVFGAICGALALGVLTAAFVTFGAFPTTLPAMLLVILELATAAGFGWLGAALLHDALTARRFNRRRYELRFELELVEIRSVDGIEQLALADAATHPLLRPMPIVGQVHTLAKVRADCRGLPPRDDVRVVLETLAVDPPEGMEVSNDGGSPPPPYYALLIDGAASFTRRDDDLESSRQEGVPIYRVDTAWDAEAQCSMPRLTPAAVRRV